MPVCVGNPFTGIRRPGQTFTQQEIRTHVPAGTRTDGLFTARNTRSNACGSGGGFSSFFFTGTATGLGVTVNFRIVSPRDGCGGTISGRCNGLVGAYTGGRVAFFSGGFSIASALGTSRAVITTSSSATS